MVASSTSKWLGRRGWMILMPHMIRVNQAGTPGFVVLARRSNRCAVQRAQTWF